MAIHQRRALELLLTDQPLEGTHAVWREVGPELLTTAVDSTSLDQAQEAISLHCVLWGGGCSVLLPVDPAVGTLAQPWQALVETNALDRISAGNVLKDNGSFKRLDLTEGFPLTESVLTVLLADAGDDELRVQAALPEEADPWWVAYAGTFGLLPEQPPKGLLTRSGLLPGLHWSDIEIVKLERETVPHPSAADLIERLRDWASFSPRLLSLHELGLRPAQWSQDLVMSPTWFAEGWMRRFVGSNIVVVYEPGSVADLCLLWTLRSAHGLPRGLPLAIPRTADVASELATWTDLGDRPKFAPKLRGMGRPWALTSASVADDELTAIAAQAGNPWEVVPFGDLLQPPARPSRTSVDIAHFVDGAATVAVWGPTDRDIVHGRPPAAFGVDLRGRTSVATKSLPRLRFLRPGWFTGGGWVAGGFDRPVGSDSDTVEVEWPSGWAVLQAAAADHGLKVRPSRPGQAAAALLDRMGSFEALDPIKDDHILGHLERLGERVGISWFRSRLRGIQSALAAESEDAAARSARLEALVDELVVPPVDDAQHELTASQLQSAFKLSPARSWLEWAESAGLIIRGARIECDRCGTKAWRPAAELAPPVICAGCGQPIERPFPADTLIFRYRASRLLIEVQASDALPHLLCAAWWVAMFRDGLYGVYPGVEFLDGDALIGEVDVVLLLRNGMLALGECKRRPNGLLPKDLENLDMIADRVHAAWTFAATLGWAEEAPTLWQTLRRDLPERRRFALCAEQLFDESIEIRSLLGVDATTWAPATSDQRTARHAQFKERLPDVIARLERPPTMAEWIASD